MLGYATVFVVVPGGRVRMFAISRVMSGMHGAGMIGNGVQVVNGFAAAAARQRIGGEVGQIQGVREIDERRQFGTEGAARRETLEMQD